MIPCWRSALADRSLCPGTVDIIIVEELIALREIYRTVKDGMAGREEFFEVAPADTDKAKDLGERLKGEKDK